MCIVLHTTEFVTKTYFEMQIEPVATAPVSGSGTATATATPMDITTDVASVATTSAKVIKYQEFGIVKSHITLVHKGETHLDMKRIIQSASGVNYVINEVLYKIDGGYLYKGFNQSTGKTVAIKQAISYKYEQANLSKITRMAAATRSNSIITRPKPKPTLSSPWNEARLFNLINSRGQHPNIIRFLDSMDVQDEIFSSVKKRPQYLKCNYIVMEFANKQTLFELISENYQHGLNEQDAKFYFRQLIQGLICLHEAGIAHLDIKLENLLLTKQDTVKITDFGLSQIVADPLPLNECIGSTALWATNDIDKHGSLGKPIDTSSTFFGTSFTRSASAPTPTPVSASFTSPFSSTSPSTSTPTPTSTSTPTLAFDPISAPASTSASIVDSSKSSDKIDKEKKHQDKRIVKRLHGPYGSIMYVSPEVWDSIRNMEEEVDISTFDPFKADVWSCGIALAILAFGNPLFDTPVRTDGAYMLVINGELNKLLKLWKYKCSDALLDLLNKILTIEEKRISLYEIMQHPWVKG